MGVYAGLIYNDYFSLGLNLFGSNYQFLTEESGSKVRNTALIFESLLKIFIPNYSRISNILVFLYGARSSHYFRNLL